MAKQQKIDTFFSVRTESTDNPGTSSREDVSRRSVSHLPSESGGAGKRKRHDPPEISAEPPASYSRDGEDGTRRSGRIRPAAKYFESDATSDSEWEESEEESGEDERFDSEVEGKP